MKENKKSKSNKYLIIGILVLFLSILGASVAYYLARVQGTLNGRVAGMDLELTITKLSTSASDDLIPLDNDLETLNLAATGYQNNGSCVDINGYSVCQIYKITLTNNGSAPLTVNGEVDLYGRNTPNIECAKMDNENTITDSASCMGTNTLASNVVLPANNHLDYYVMVYIKNLDEPQYDSGDFNGTVTFTSIDGKKVKGRFKHDDTLAEYITKLYNNAEKTVVTTIADCERDDNGFCKLDENSSSENPIASKTLQYNYATSVGLMNDRLGGTTEDLDGGNIRYYGAEPNNYIYIGDVDTKPWKKDNIFSYLFETSEQCHEFANCETNYEAIGALSWRNFTNPEQCEAAMPSLLSSVGATSIDEICDKQPILWRIIGVFDGKVRIRRDSNIGRYLYDRTKAANNIGGINQWAPSNNYKGADIMKLLNPGYETNTDFDTDGTTEITINNSLYWNSGNGNCWGTNNGSNAVSNVSCDFVGNGLSDEAKEFIINQTVYLGGFDNYYVFANQAYTIERGTNVIQNPIDGISRTVKWTGKVGLPYPSDVGYASDLNDINCQNHLGNFAFCNSNWMMDGSSFLQNPSTNVANYQSFVYKTKNIDHNYNEIDSNYVNIRGGAWPVVTLSPDVYISQGTGSKDDPYVINGLNYEYEYVSPFQTYEGKPS